MAESNFVSSTEVTLDKELSAGSYVLVPCCQEPGDQGKFTLTVMGEYISSLFNPEADSVEGKEKEKEKV